MIPAWAVLRKECLDHLRDRRTLLFVCSITLIGPAGFVALMSFVLNTTLGDANQSVPLAVVGEQYAPNFIRHLRTENIELSFPELADAEQAVRERRESLVLVIPDYFQDRFVGGDPVTLALIYDGSDQGSTRNKVNRIRGIISQYGQKIALLRLQLRGIDPEITLPILVQDIDTASPAARALTLLATLPYLLVFVVFMGGFHVAIDTTAGEREQGSLEPLLTQPISRWQLVTGKLGATCLFSLIALALFLTGIALAIPWVPLHKVGMSLEINFSTCLAIIAICTPLVVFGAAALTVTAAVARSYKEAQTFLSVVILIPTLPLIVTQLLNVEATWWLMLIPSVSQATLISDLLTGESLQPLFILLSMAGTALLALMLCYLAIWLYRRERILG